MNEEIIIEYLDLPRGKQIEELIYKANQLGLDGQRVTNVKIKMKVGEPVKIICGTQRHIRIV